MPFSHRTIRMTCTRMSSQCACLMLRTDLSRPICQSIAPSPRRSKENLHWRHGWHDECGCRCWTGFAGQCFSHLFLFIAGFYWPTGGLVQLARELQRSDHRLVQSGAIPAARSKVFSFWRRCTGKGVTRKGSTRSTAHTLFAFPCPRTLLVP